MSAGKGSTKVRVRAKLAGKALQKPAVVNQPIARCITGYCCSVCKPDYNMALAMGLHMRLGEDSPLAVLTDDLLRAIIEMTKPKRQLPAWMSCSWNVRMQERRSSRVAKRKGELHSGVEYKSGDTVHGASTSQPDSTGQAV